MLARSFAFAAMLTAAAALAQGPPPAPAEKQQRICRGGGERQLGSHVRTRRRCLTAEQWQAEEDARARAPGLQITPGQNDGLAPARPG